MASPKTNSSMGLSAGRKKSPARYLRRLACGVFVLGALTAHAAQKTDIWTGAASNVWDTSSVNWQGGRSFFQSGDHAVFDDNFSGAVSVTLQSAGVSVGDVHFSHIVGAVATNYVFSSTGAAGIADWNGTPATVTLDLGYLGSVRMGLQNTYTGGTTINGGTMIVTNAASLGAITGRLTINSGTLEVAAGFSTSRPITLGSAASTIQVDAGQTYTTANAVSGSGALSKTGAGTLILNASNTYSGGTNVTAGTLQMGANSVLPATGLLTVSGGTLDLKNFSQTTVGIVVTGGAIVGTGSLSTSSSYALQSGTLSLGLGGSGGLAKTTSGTVTLASADSYTGNTTISAGKLIVAALNGEALGGTSSITVGSGGTLLLGANNQINTAAALFLSGGTFAKGDYAEGAANSVGLGALTLSASSSRLDFGTGTVGVLSFASFTAAGHLLLIDNWTGTTGIAGTNATDRLIFDSDQASNLSNFSFTGYATGAREFDLGGGFFEVAPLTPVPEPSTYAAGCLGLLGVGYSLCRERRRRRSAGESLRRSDARRH